MIDNPDKMRKKTKKQTLKGETSNYKLQSYFRTVVLDKGNKVIRITLYMHISDKLPDLINIV